MKDRYIIRKYVMAKSVSGALRKEKSTPVHDCWIDDEWKKNHEELASCIGFERESERDYED